jgi:hypothetical protein
MWRALTAGLLVALIAAAPARADSYAVTGSGDSATPAPCTAVGAGAWTCETLRAATLAANADPNADFIAVGPLPVQLNAGSLVISENVTIAGSGAQVTTVGGVDLSDRVFTITNTSVVDLSGMTVSGGFNSGLGGNILVEIGSELSLRLARVTRGNAISGGGIAVRGKLTVDTSLIDDNTAQASGGGIANRAEDNIVNTTVTNSTLAKNYAAAGGGLYSVGLATTTLIHTTIGRNTGEGVYLQNAQTAVATGVIIAGNLAGTTAVSCGGTPFSSATASITDGTTCGFPLQALDPQLSQDLVPFPAATLPTSVLTIPASSPAVDIVNPCQYPVDQRFAPRYSGVLGACDAGAYEESANGGGGPAPTPTPVPVPTPTPVASPTPEPPVFNRTVGVAPVRGTVEVCPPRERCRPLRAGETIPMRSTVDTRKGRVRLTSLPSAGGAPQSAEFYDGIFRVTQVGSITQLTLTEKLAPCSSRARAAQKKPKSRRLWGDGKGKFRTKGRYAAATVRGTRWLTQDNCKGTLIRVAQGSVSVRDFGARKTVVVRKGKRYLARARR